MSLEYPDHRPSFWIYGARENQELYLIENTITNYVKIGISNNVYSRLRNICNKENNPLILRKVFTFSECTAFDAEQELHNYFKFEWEYGEWFNVTVEEVLLAITQISSSEDVSKRYTKWLNNVMYPKKRADKIRVWDEDSAWKAYFYDEITVEQYADIRREIRQRDKTSG